MTDEADLDVESIVRDVPAGRRAELRLWLRLLSCSNLIGTEIRRRLRADFDVTLPRFDLMAQLDREPDGLRLGELSRRMMVTNGNLTGLVDRLVEERLVLRESVPEDRRAMVVRLTAEGRARFADMAKAHEGWIRRLFGDLDRRSLDRLMGDLEQLKNSVRAHHGDR